MSQIIVGCGIDIIEIKRIAKALKKPRFSSKIYTQKERQSLEGRHPRSWAVRFAAKEAVMKAMGCGWRQGVAFTDIEIMQDTWGKPIIKLRGKAEQIADEQGISQIHISLTHDKISAIAYAIAVGGRK